MNDKTAIQELLEQRYANALNSGDIEGYVALYSVDVLWSVAKSARPSRPTDEMPG